MVKKPYRNLKSENYQDYAQKPQQNRVFMILPSELVEESMNGEGEGEVWRTPKKTLDIPLCNYFSTGHVQWGNPLVIQQNAPLYI
jgi:hypothetical protein